MLLVLRGRQARMRGVDLLLRADDAAARLLDRALGRAHVAGGRRRRDRNIRLRRHRSRLGVGQFRFRAIDGDAIVAWIDFERALWMR